jgi:hypothetical protein
VPRAVRDLEKALKGYKVHRSLYLDAKDHVVTALCANEHLTEAATLWPARCSGAYAKAAPAPRTSTTARARVRPRARGRAHVRVRDHRRAAGHGQLPTIVGPADTHPLAHLFPDPRDVKVAGRA